MQYLTRQKNGVNKMKDYSKLPEVTVTSQAEMDEIPLDFSGRIYIKADVAVIVKNKYYFSVVAWENSSVVAWENSSVVAWENSSVVARENSSVVARGNSSVEARENSSVVAQGNSSVVARENSSVVARGNSQITDQQISGKIQVSGNARIVYMPKNINDFIDFYGIKHTKTKATFYKAVRKCGGVYHSDRNRDFVYPIGGTVKEDCDRDPTKECSFGIHISHMDWALSYGAGWRDLAILEVETKISDIVMPQRTDGKVRTCAVKVIREVPLEECGVYGKILAKRLNREAQ